MSQQEQILITGGSGFLGARLAHLILRTQPNANIVVTDIARSPRLESLHNKVRFLQADLSNRSTCRELVTPNTVRIFHLASLVSGGAEQDFEAGLKANVLATINLLEACRVQPQKPVVVFTSSIATFGGNDLPEEVTDWTFQHPQNSYGVAKVVGEQLLNDYSRKGYLDGRGVRLPAIVVRDIPNTAVSGYASGLIRETLHGKDYPCPASPKSRMPIMGVHKAVQFLFELSQLKEGQLGDYRTLNGRGISPAAYEIAEAVQQCAPSDRPVGHISFKSDPQVQHIIDSWPKWMTAERAVKLGLPGDNSIEELIQDYIRFDLPSSSS